MLDEITPRLTQELRQRVAFADNLKPALNLACRQLELLSPAVMGHGKDGMVASLATHCPKGAWLMVLANQRKVLTIHSLATPECSFLTGLENCVRMAQASADVATTGEGVLHLINALVNKFGGKPGAKTPRLEGDRLAPMLGALFAPCSPEERADIVKGVETLADAGICPLHVGLVGRGTNKGTMSGVWPLGMPFVPYIDSLGLA